ncbi:MAG: Ig-like domain-containing protein [Gammaproteobacteria bacterium]
MNMTLNTPTRPLLFIVLALTAALSACGLSCDDCDGPIVTAVTPLDGAVEVATGTNLTARFDVAMDPASINSTTFTVTGPGGVAVAGTVSYAPTTAVATFNPSAALAPNTLYTATITTGAQNQQGTPLAAAHTWTFTTISVPEVVATIPLNAGTGVCTGSTVSATFSESLDPATVNTSTFTVSGPGGPVAGTVAYDDATLRATFTPSAALATNAIHTATVTTGVRNALGNALAEAVVWTFTTGAQACAPVLAPVAPGLPAPSLLTAAAPYGNLGGTAGSTNQGLLTIINGDFASTATTTGSITGFHDNGGDIYTETPLNAGHVDGFMHTCTVSTTGPNSAAVNAANCTLAMEALADAQDVYDNVISPAALPGGVDPNAGQLGGLTLAPGVYMAAGGSWLLTGTDLVLDGQGDANALFVFQSNSSLTVGGPGAPRSIILINNAQAGNVYWYVGSSAVINAAGGGTMVGTIIAQAGAAFSTAGNADIVTLDGRAVGLTASVTLVNTIINVPAN